MQRIVEAEWLDGLPALDPKARGSRRDLRVLNYWMGNAGIVARSLNSVSVEHAAKRLIEIGAGDGHFMLRVARQLGPGWGSKNAVLVDRQNAVSGDTLKGFAALGWGVESVQADVFEWMQRPAALAGDIVVANLFAHHFDDGQLAALFCKIAKAAGCFIALEPQRSLWSLSFSLLVGVLGCNRVTRHDAPISVRAGFAGNDLSRLWPETPEWRRVEHRAGPFSHLFIASRGSVRLDQTD